MSDKVSIIIPTRNRWRLLAERAVRSVERQTYRNWELIIIDDGSNVKCPYSFYGWPIKIYRIEKVYTYPKDNKKAEWLAGPCLALNEALKYVTGDWIARLDDDDIWTNDCLESLLKFAKEGNYDFVSALWKDKDGLIGIPYYEFHNSNGWIIAEYLGGCQTWLYRAKYKDIKYNSKCWEKPFNANNELDWFERLVEKHHPKIGFLPKVVCTILPRPGLSIIGSKAYLEEHNVFA